MQSLIGQFSSRLVAVVLAGAPALLSAQAATGGVTADPAAVAIAVTTATGPVLVSANPGQLINLGVRGTLGTDETLITGFVISEPTGSTVLVRAAGPALAPFGVYGSMANPKLQVFDASGNIVAANDDWSLEIPPFASEAPLWSVQQAAQMVAAFPFSAESRDAAVVVKLPPGAYTLVISGSTSADTGVVLGEVYLMPLIETLDAAIARGGKPISRLTNLSARGRIADGTGADSEMIGSFVVRDTFAAFASGASSSASSPTKRFLIRVAGPALADYGLAAALPDPSLEVVSTTGTRIAFNDNWDADAAEADALREAAASVGAFPLKAGGRDAAMIVRLPAGAYSAIARGVNGATGAALIEIYELSN